METNSAAHAFAFAELQHRACAESWTPLVLAPDIASISARVGEENISMRSCAWNTAQFRLIRATSMESQKRIQVFNLVAYPRCTFDIPVFATDIVVLGGKLRIGVMDAMPLFAHETAYHDKWIRPFEPLALKSREIAPRFELKMEWSKEYLGTSACLATGLAGDALDPLLQLWKAYWDLYMDRARQESPAPPARRDAVEAWHREYNREHAEVEMKRNPLVKYYGSEFGHRFIHEFLFGDSLGL